MSLLPTEKTEKTEQTKQAGQQKSKGASFVHLRVHSAYSLLEGALQIQDLFTYCKDQKSPAIAITDSNNLFAALEFSVKALGQGVQPIIGCALSVQVEGEVLTPEEKPPSVLLFCQNEAGYRNLSELVSSAHLDVESGDFPHVTVPQLCDLNEGLLLLTGGSEGPWGQLLQRGQVEKAEALLQEIHQHYDSRLYLEIQRHGLPAERQTEPLFAEWAERFSLPLIATNNAFFLERKHYRAHDALLCIAQGTQIDVEDRFRLNEEFYLKSVLEMETLFKDLPEALENTVLLAQRCAETVRCSDPILPRVEGQDGRTESEELSYLAKQGLKMQLEHHVFQSDWTDEKKEEVAKEYWARLDYELSMIERMGFPGYFLIVADFIRWAKEQLIPVGPGRGSGAGSVVAWSLSITALDPLRWGLLFERFLNPERVSMPDFDIDFCQERRGEVITYVQQRYGRDRVAQIITFGKLLARAVLRDVGRVMGLPYGLVDKITKMIPSNPANPLTLTEALEGDEDLRRRLRNEPEVAQLFEISMQLEGLFRHASTHAAGVVIGDRKLTELVPLYKDPRSDMPATQFNMKWVEQAGLVKFDFLGLKNLTIIRKTLSLLENRGITLDIDQIPLDDPKTFKLLAKAETVGVFQLESTGMRDVLRKLRPDRFEDIIAVVALYRPGPMDNIPSYISRKHGEEKPDYLHPSLKNILEETYGIMIYQEQVMQAAQEMAGYSLGNADLLRRAMGKKIKEEMDQQRAVFVRGAQNNGVSTGKANAVFDQINKFAGYGFNKSHAAAYALVSYQTAYLKANYPVEFIAATMTTDINNTDSLAKFKEELDHLSIPLLVPDINRSDVEFAVETLDDGRLGIRYALGGLKNVGEAAMGTLVAERQEKGAFKDLEDFFTRIDPRSVNKRSLENMIRAGVFDSLHENRCQLLLSTETLSRIAMAAQVERESQQTSFFAMESDIPQSSVLRLQEASPWGELEKLKEEFLALGFYLSAHPLESYEESLASLGVSSSSTLRPETLKPRMTMAGILTMKRERRNAKGQSYAFVTLSDAQGSFEIGLFSDTYSQYRSFLEEGNLLLVEVGTRIYEGEIRLNAVRLSFLEDQMSEVKTLVKLEIKEENACSKLQEILTTFSKGKSSIEISVPYCEDKEAVITLPKRYRLDSNAFAAVKAIDGLKIKN